MNRRHMNTRAASGAALILAITTAPLAAETIAYWRFEGDGVTTPVEASFIQDTNGRAAIQPAGIPVPDTSGNGNTLYTWNDDTTGHVQQPAAEDAPFLAVPLSQETNGWFIENAGGDPASFTWSPESAPTGTNLDTWTSLTWTIEASIRPDEIGGHKTFVGREGNGVATGDGAHAPIYFQMTPDGTVRIRYVDAAGNIHNAQDDTPLVPGFWYHFAATCDGTDLLLFKRETGGLFEEVGYADVSGSADPSLVDPGNDINGDPWGWTVGRGRYGSDDNPNANHGDRWLGAIDEVRISDAALDPATFLAAFPATASDTDADSLPDAWELANIGDLFEGPADDWDVDYATNRLEYLNGTDPDDDTDWPDVDVDGLNDGWEMYFFPTPPPNVLAAEPDVDSDNDFNDNLAEFLAETDPTSDFSYPDEDFDWMNDGWERFYYGEGVVLTDVDPAVDDDGDLFTNLEEFDAGTHPLEQVSSPDTDFDNLADGWEVKYFRVADEDLATVIAYQDGLGDPDGDHLNNRFEQAGGTDPNDPGSAEATVGYWRFEEMTIGEVPAGGNQEYAFPTSIQDSSVYGNHMMAWADYSRPNYEPLVRDATVPATGEDNTASLLFERNNNGVYYIEAIFSTDAQRLGADPTLRTAVFDEFTVEATFNTSVANTWQVPVAKFGNPVGGQPPFSLKIDTANFLRAGIVDGSGAAAEIIGTTPIVTDSWYSAAVTVTDTEMQLWLKGPDSSGYTLEGTVAVDGAWYVPAEGPYDTPWNIGAGQWAGTQTDAFAGTIDEVRVSAMALTESEFLFYEEAAAGFPAWAEAEITDPAQRGENDDPDGDGTINIVEFWLGLGPMDGSSYFGASLDGDTLEWPAADGLEFTIWRSTNLSDWEDIDTVIATGATASWSDPAPPAGAAFYQVELPTE